MSVLNDEADEEKVRNDALKIVFSKYVRSDDFTEKLNAGLASGQTIRIDLTADKVCKSKVYGKIASMFPHLRTPRIILDHPDHVKKNKAFQDFQKACKKIGVQVNIDYVKPCSTGNSAKFPAKIGLNFEQISLAASS